MSLNQTNSSIISGDNKNEREVVLGDDNSVSDISKPVSFVSPARLNRAEVYTRKRHKIHGNTYVCTFCGYTTKEAHRLMNHMQFKHKCKTLRCSKCNCETTLLEFAGKPHKCKVDNSKNITSNTEETSDRELELDSANSEPPFDDEITIEKTELDVDNEAKQETNKVVPEMNVANMSFNQINSNIISDDDRNEGEMVLDDTNIGSDLSRNVSSVSRWNGTKVYTRKRHKIHGNTYVCTFCGYTTKEAHRLMTHMQLKHKCKKLRCSKCNCVTTLSEFAGKPHKCKVNNSETITSHTEVLNDKELELDSANSEPVFDDEITIEKTELDVDSEAKQETNKMVHKMNVATLSPNQTNLSILSDDNKNEREVLGANNSLSDTSKPISFVSPVRLYGDKVYTRKRHKIHDNTYICTFCDYTTKEANSLMSHVQHKHKCETLRSSTCHCDTTSSEFVGKPHKCKVDNSKNITSNTEETSDRELELDSANSEPLFDDEITIEKTELEVDSEAKQEINEAHGTNISTMSLNEPNSTIIIDDNENANVVPDDTNSVSNVSNLVPSVSTVELNGAKQISTRMQKLLCSYKCIASQYDLFKCTYDKETKISTCIVCSFQTRDRSRLRKHFEKEHRDKLHKCLICSFEAKQQRALLNHYREKHDIRECLTKEAIENKKNEESNKNRRNTYICPFCGFTAEKVNNLISHMQQEHKCKTLKCNVLRQEATLTDFLIKSRKCKIGNTCSDTEKTSDRELELGSTNDVDSDVNQKTNQVVQENDVATMSLDQTNLNVDGDDDNDKNEGEAVLDDTNSISNISKPVPSVSTVRSNGTKKSSKETNKIHGYTYICTFCGYTTKEVNGLMSHMQCEHDCKTLRCSTCHCEATLSEFVGKPHKCKVDNPEYITSDTEESGDGKLKNSANLESNSYDEITIEKSEFDIENDLKEVLDETDVVSENHPKKYLCVTATKEEQIQFRSSVNDIFKCTYDKETKILTCTQCSFETKDRSCLRKHFKKKHGNKPYKCLICTFKVKQQRVLSNHYREKHKIRDYLTKKDIERNTSKHKNNEESNEDEQDLSAEMNTEQTTENNGAESNKYQAADEEGTKNKTKTSDSNGQSESEKIKEQTNENAVPQNKWEEFKCMDCDFKSYELRKVVSHIREVHNKTDVPSDMQSTDAKLSLNIVICPYCGLTISEKTSLLEHMRKEHKSKEVLKCSQCNFKTKSEEGLKKHKAYTHELHACPECDYKAKQRVCVRRHFSLYHADKYHKCSKCDFKTYNESELSNHVYLEHDETALIHKCDKCSYKTDNLIRFKKHRCRNYPEICLYKCVHCEYKSRRRHGLVKHLEKIHNEYIVK